MLTKMKYLRIYSNKKFDIDFYERVVGGKEKVSIRFSRNRSSPYKSLLTGDEVLIKRSGGMVTAKCIVGRVWYYELNDEYHVSDLIDKYYSELSLDEMIARTLIAANTNAKYATVYEMLDMQELSEPFSLAVFTRSGWVKLGNEARVK